MFSAVFSISWIIIISRFMQMDTQTVPMLLDTSEAMIGSDEEPRCLHNVTIEEISKINSTATSLCIVDSTLTRIGKNTLSRFSNLNILVLVNVSLREVSPNAFAQLSNLKKVDLTDNIISSILPLTFQSTQKLEELSLKRNKITDASNIISALSTLPSFLRLDLSKNDIQTLEIRDVEVSKLEILNISGCKLTRFAIFSPSALKKLYLGNNYLKSEFIDLSGFNNSIRLKELYLGNIHTVQTGRSPVYNYFPEIENDFLPNLSYLTLLDLQNCDIGYINPLAFSSLSRLETLIVRSNQLPTIPSAVTSLKNLKNLDMSYNGKKEVDFELRNVAFSTMHSLENLNLSYNKLTSLHANAFYGLTNLTILSLESSELMEIKPYAFRTLKSLTCLDLSKNHLTVIINDTFADLESLTHLKLSRNSLKIYKENHPFLPTVSLQVLEFQHNSLCELWDYLIPHLSNLTYLDMSYNKIVQWRWDGFPTSGSLKRANFEDNEITAITQPMLENLLTLESGMFANNPYNCSDCEIANVQELLKTPVYSPYKNGYRCQYKYKEEDYFVFNSTLPPRCLFNSFSYIAVGIGVGFLLIFLLVLVSLAYHFRWYIRYRWFVAQCHLKNWHKPLQRKQSYLYDAFISYSDKDRYWIKNEFLPRLENDFHFHFCVHERDFEPGRNITDNIFEGIDRSKMFIAILTENFLASQWCLWEMNMAICKMAIEQCNNLVIIKLHTISKDKLTRSIQYLIKTKTYLSWPVTPIGQRLFWERVIHVLQKCTSNSEATANPV